MPCLSEVLLSSEARMITYVSKVGVRSEHSLDDVMLSGETASVHTSSSFSAQLIPFQPNHRSTGYSQETQVHQGYHVPADQYTIEVDS